LRALAAPHEARARTAPAPFPARAGAASSRVPVGAIAERRSPRTPVARRIERAVLERRGPSAPSSWAIGSGAGRAIVVVQNAGGRVRLIALCAPPAREAVARALEQARYALAGRGIALDAPLAGEGPCT
jgi:hypothetical protein